MGREEGPLLRRMGEGKEARVMREMMLPSSVSSRSADVTEELVFFLWMLGCASLDAMEQISEESAGKVWTR